MTRLSSLTDQYGTQYRRPKKSNEKEEQNKHNKGFNEGDEVLVKTKELTFLYDEEKKIKGVLVHKEKLNSFEALNVSRVKTCQIKME